MRTKTDWPVIGIAGWKNSGKTTLAVRLIEEFARRGLKLFSVTFEFGVAERQIMLGDELTPRTCFVGDGQPRPRRTREAGGGNGRPPAEPYRLMRDRLLGIPAGRTQA